MSGLMKGLFFSVPPYHGKHCVHPSTWSYPNNLVTLVVSDTIEDNKVSHLEKEYIVDLSCSPPSYNISCISPKEVVQTEEFIERIKENKDEEENTRTNSNTEANIPVSESPPEEPPASSQAQEITTSPEVEISSMQDKVSEVLEERTPSPQNHTEKDDKPLVKTEEELSDEIHNNVTASASPEMPQNAKKDLKVNIPEVVSSHLLFEHLGLIHAESADGEPSLSVPISDEYLEKYPLLKATDSLLLLTQGGQTEVYWNEPSESDTDSMSTPTDSPSHRPTPRPIVSPILFKSGSSFGLHSPDNLPAGYLPSEAELQQLAQQLGLQDSQLPFSFAEGTLYLDPDIIDLTMIPPPITPDQEKTVDFLASISTPPTPFADKETVELFNEVAESMKDVIVPPIDPQHSPSFQGKRPRQKHRVKDQSWTDFYERHQPSTYLIYSLDYDSDSGNETISSENVEMSSQETSQDISENLNILDFSQYLCLNGFPIDSQLTIIPDSHDIDSFIARVTVPPPPLLCDLDLPGRTLSSLSDDIDAFIIPPPPSLDSSPMIEGSQEFSGSEIIIGTENQPISEESKTDKTDHTVKCDDLETNNQSLQTSDNKTVLYFEPGTHMTHSTTESDNEDNETSFKKIIPHTSQSFDNSSPTASSLECKRSSSYQDIPNIISQSKLLGFRTPAPTRKSSLGSSKLLIDNQPILDPSSSKSIQNKKTPLGLNRLKKTEALAKKLPVSSSTPSRLSKSHINGESEAQTKGVKVLPPNQRIGLLATKSKGPNALQEKDFISPSKASKLTLSKNSQELIGHDVSNKSSSKEPSLSSKISRIPSSRFSSANGNGDYSSEKFNGPCLSRKSNNSQNSKSASPSSPEKFTIFSPKKSPTLNQTVENQPILFDQKSGNSGTKIEISSKPGLKFSGNINQSTASFSYRFDDPYEKCRFTTFKGNGSSQKKKESTMLPSSTLGSKLPLMKSKTHPVSVEPSKLGSPSKSIQFSMNTNKHLSEEEVELTLPEPDYPTDGSEELQLAQDQISSIIKQMDAVLETLKSFTTETNMEKFLYAKDMLISESRRFVTASKLFVKSATESEEKVIQNLKHCIAMLRCICETAFTVAEHSDSVAQAQNLISKVRDVATSFRNNVHIAAKVVGKPLSDPGMKVLMQQATNLATALTALMRTLRVIDVPT